MVRSRRSINFKPGIGLSQSVLIGLGSPRAGWMTCLLLPRFLSPLGKIVAFGGDFHQNLLNPSSKIRSSSWTHRGLLLLASPPRIPTTCCVSFAMRLMREGPGPGVEVIMKVKPVRTPEYTYMCDASEKNSAIAVWARIRTYVTVTVLEDVIRQNFQPTCTLYFILGTYSMIDDGQDGVGVLQIRLQGPETAYYAGLAPPTLYLHMYVHP